MKDQVRAALLLYEAKQIGLEELLSRIDQIYHPQEDNSLEARKITFIEEVRIYLDVYGKDLLNSFCKHWLEKSVKGRKFRFEKETTFDVNLRLKMWEKRSKQYSIVNMLNKGRPNG